MVYKALEAIRHRNKFYRDGYRKIVIALIFSLVLNVILGIAVLFSFRTKTRPTYFATTEDGRIIPLVPLNRPNINDKALLSWVAKAIISVYSYNFVNYREAIQSASTYFVPSGWKKFLNALSGSKGLDAVKENKYVVSAVARGAPVITNRYVLGGRYVWKIQMPITVTYQNSDGAINQEWLVSLTVVRASSLTNPEGIGISQFVVS